MFERLAALGYDEVEISAGSFACDGRHIFVGTFSGWAAFDMGSLACVWSEPDLLPKNCDVSGVQPTGTQVVMLGNTRFSNCDSPRDWGAKLFVGQLGSPTRVAHHLPPGNWRMVRHCQGDRVHLYDVSEGGGLITYDRRGLAWRRAPTDDISKVLHFSGRLLCLGKKRLAVSSRDGEFLFDRELPQGDTYRWTTATAWEEGRIALGGHNRRSKDFAVALLGSGAGDSVRIVEHELRSVFSDLRIAHAQDDECCGIDIFDVARMQFMGRDMMCLALGGGGEELGACHGAGALGLMRLDRPTEAWRTQVVDESDGISGLTRLADGRLLVDFCGQIRIYNSTMT